MTRQQRIMIVDDNPGDVELMRIALEMSGITVEVECVSDGVEAMRRLSKAANEKDLPAMVLLDLNMPRANGFEVLDFLCVRNLMDKVAVVVLTTSRQLVDRRRCMGMGVKAMYSKPESIQELQRLVEDFRVYLVHPGVSLRSD